MVEPLRPLMTPWTWALCASEMPQVSTTIATVMATTKAIFVSLLAFMIFSPLGSVFQRELLLRAVALGLAPACRMRAGHAMELATRMVLSIRCCFDYEDRWYYVMGREALQKMIGFSKTFCRCFAREAPSWHALPRAGLRQ
jgi:hypothetical protein